MANSFKFFDGSTDGGAVPCPVIPSATVTLADTANLILKGKDTCVERVCLIDSRKTA